MRASKAAIRVMRVKTNFKTEPWAMIWREKPIYVISNNYSNAFHLPHPFPCRRPDIHHCCFKSSFYDLRPAEGSSGLCHDTQGKEEHPGVNREIPGQQVSIKANWLGSTADRQKPTQRKSIWLRIESHKPVKQISKRALGETTTTIYLQDRG